MEKDILYHIRIYNNSQHTGYVSCVVDSDSGEVYANYERESKQEAIVVACDDYPDYDQVTDTTE